MSTSKPVQLNRRQVIRGILATTAFGAATKFGTGCTPASQTQASSNAEDKPIVMGFIYVGPKDDFGYNQAHAEGKQGLAKLTWLKTVEEANVPETTAVEETMRNMIEEEGATVLFPTSFGYFDPHILKIAKEYPEVQFFHCGGLYQEGKHPKNVGSYFGYIDEAQYVAGIVAAHTSKTGKLGFIAAKPIPQVLRNINSFNLGARSINPKITTQVVFTGDWALPVKEAEAANSMADQDIDVITCHVDSPKVVMETAERRGIFCSGYHANQAKLAPKGYLTGAEWNWAQVYSRYAEMIRAGKTLMNGGIPHLVRGGLKDGFLKMSPYGAAVSAEAKKDADAVKEKFIAGNMTIYRAGLKDNTGKVVVPNKDFTQTAIELEKMNWLAEGVIGRVAS
ncbi:MAG: Purine-binding protein [Chroococcidiopsis cubana SAG 39.79]|uniref:ABC transporter substrate-binding protein n=1 Tax=Chroococcidiopsis cubana SAG 39.79 TaxID=388085 RepID=A0AB37U7R3_9CYAN|nr:BMP family ABC transporter substrate-binding protein [Chroococcidiopsis cubana]MDZ4872060.1 Purine-binding protein [Chroococcidiopsis cubana SAG 39.79]PSB55173.1 BMP family ABC transporter substrate-binding protein [Chroococcidiopsis cubana CCALA 043]RUS95017.1 ABC transporter substrate-binding protein [Chroococcidiopsis cubana SAG 39.79]